METMDESNKLPLKRVELSLSKFNEVAIPHHLDLLRQHKLNIIKHESAAEWSCVRSEQLRARRVCAQLRELLADMLELRRAVRPQDRAAFDARTLPARQRTLRAVADYMESVRPATERHREEQEEKEVSGSLVSSESVGLVEQEQERVQPQELEAREAALRGYAALAAEVRALHEAWQLVQAAALAQREGVERAGGAVLEADAAVAAARVSLGGAERLRAAAWGAGGAALGAAAGGPLGLVLGVKAGALAALAGSLLGYCTGRLAARAPVLPPLPPMLPPLPALPPPAEHDKTD